MADKVEDKKEVLDLTLDQVHEQAIQDLENEEEGGDDDSAKDDKDSAGEDAGADKADDAKDKDDAGTGDAGAGEDDDKKDDADGAGAADKPREVVDDAKDKVEPAPELDTDSTKNATGKVAVKDFEDKTHYFNNLEEVPEDFEPKSYKEFGRFVQKMTDKEQSDRKAVEEAGLKAVQDERDARIKSIKDDWDRDIKTLTDNKTLPADEKERQPVIDAVFDVMNEKLARGKVIDFETGYEIYASKQSGDDKKDAADKSNADKKKRGAMVAGAGSGASAKPRMIEGPPAGTSLDDVHESVLRGL